ncbi:MAG: VCBS repeat-containing protein [Candidatus Magnetomorum sp.]|nr:VCBS repeat-containing protein [Candidatus Magnetomorum sp.]
MRFRQGIFIRLMVLGCFLVLVSCGGDFQDANCKNCAPIAKASVIKRVRIKQKVELDGSGSKPGPDGGALTYEWTLLEKPDGSDVTLINPEKVNPSFFPDRPGKYVIQLIVSDGITDSKPCIIEFTTLNSRPVARAEYNDPVRISEKVLLSAETSTDDDNDPLTYQWNFISKPESSSATLTSIDTVESSFLADRKGQYIVQLVVNDGQIASEPKLLIVQVYDGPVAKAIVNEQVPVKQKVNLDGSESKPGPNGGSLTYAWTLLEKPDGSNTKLYRPETVTPYFYPDKPGKYRIQLIVNDGVTDSDPSIIDFITLNSRPVARAEYNAPVRISETVLLSAAKSYDDDNEPLTYRWTLISTPESSSATLTKNDSVDPSFIADLQGQYIVQLVVNDGHIESTPYLLKVQVYNGPAAKVTFKEQLPVQQKVQLDGSESTPGVGGNALTYQWTLKSKPEGSTAELSDPTSARPTFIPDKPGVYIIELVVNDGKSSSVPAIIEYETLNSKPVAVCDYNRPIYINQTVQLDGSASSDLDEDPLTYQWLLSLKPLNSNANLSDTGIVNPTFIADRPGRYVVQLVVNDGKEDSNKYTLIVKTENSKPIAKAGDDVTVFEGETVQLDASLSSDADESPLTFQWTVQEKPNGSTAKMSGQNKINPTITPDVPGNYIIQLVVNDGELDSEPDSIEIKANPSIDLEPGQIDLSNLNVDPETLEVKGTVTLNIINQGTRAVTDDFLITLFEDQNQNNQLDPTDPVIANQTVTDGPEGKDSITVPVLVDGKVSFRDNIIFVMIDPLNTIPERNETNNLMSSAEGKQCKPAVGQFSPKLAWEWTGSNDFPLSNQVICTPLVGNLTDDNNDGKIDLKDIPDIVFITFEGNNYEKRGIIRAISGDGSKEHFSIGPVSTGNKYFEAFPTYNSALGDIDNDGIVEILVVMNDQADSKWLAVFENTGTLKWISEDTSSSQLTRPVSINIADLDANGAPEIIIGNLVLSSTGKTLMIGKEDNGFNNSTVADIDLDNHMEIIAGRTVYEADGKILWHISELEEGFTAVANFDADDYPEIVHLGRGKLSLIEHTGEIIWGPKEIAPGGPFRGDGGPPLISDVDGDGKPEIGIAGSSKFSVFNSNGSILWTADIKDPSSVTSASAFDFEGDGKTEIVYRDSESLKIFNGRNGNLLYEDRAGSGTFIEMPIIADVDNDNSAEIVVPCNSYVSGNVTGIRVYKDATDHWVNTRKIWNQHAYVITNVYEDGRIPKVPINNWETYNNFRQNQIDNPFGCKDISASYIRFDLSKCPDQIQITARVGNGGGLHIPKNTLVSFYLGNPSGTGRLIGEVEIGKVLYPGDWVDLTVRMDNAGSEKNNIFVLADSDEKLWESSEDNNLTQKSFTCQ